MTRRALVAVAAALVLAPAASAKPLLGVLGNADKFQAQTGQVSTVRHVIAGWGQGQAFGGSWDQLLLGEVPMFGFGTRVGGRGTREAVTPRSIAQGHGDAFLVALNRAIAERGGRVYVRPLAEMNGHWNPYCAFTKAGKPKGPAYTTAWFKKAFARIYLIVHGPPDANARLRRLGLPPVAGELARNPLPRTRVVWNPQGYGSPDIPGNSAAAYYPGDAFVDVVGNDLYNIRGKAEWAAAERLYRAYPRKPHAFPEWANWGIDDPAFVIRMARFVRTHPRVEMLAYYARGATFDLADKPRTRAAYRRHIVPLGA